MKLYKGMCLMLSAFLMSGCSLVGMMHSEVQSGIASGASENETESQSVSDQSESGSSSDSDENVQTDLAADDMFTDRDYETGYDEDASTVITLEGSTAACESDAVEITDSTVTIMDEGTYILLGTLDNGMIIVDAQDTDKIQIVLNGANVSCTNSAALYIREADKVFVTTVADTENTLSSLDAYENIDDDNIDGAVFSKSDLTFNGSGQLTVTSEKGHGIVCKDDLVFTGGSYEISGANHGISGKDSVRIAGGTFNITSGKDGIHSENADDTSLGFLYIADGTFSIASQGDGLSAQSELLLEGGSYNIQTGDGSSDEQIQKDVVEASSDESSTSTKGMKSSGTLTIKGGTFEIDSLDDAVHSDESVYIAGGDFIINTGDDGIHADEDLIITSGEITISQSYEGLEGLTVNISGGVVDLTSSDDGLNAAGGSDQSGYEGFGGGFRGKDNFASDSGADISISGGKIYVNASGDGLDSNGSITVSGGELYVSGPDNGGNGALDYNTEAVITGGIVVASGTSQMAQNFGSSSTQGAMLVEVGSQEASSTVTMYDESHNTIISWTPQKAYDCVLISCPEISEGNVYTLVAGSNETEVTMESLIYSFSESGMGGQNGGRNSGPGGMNQRP